MTKHARVLRPHLLSKARDVLTFAVQVTASIGRADGQRLDWIKNGSVLTSVAT